MVDQVLSWWKAVAASFFGGRRDGILELSGSTLPTFIFSILRGSMLAAGVRECSFRAGGIQAKLRSTLGAAE